MELAATVLVDFVTLYGFFLIWINYANKFIDFQGEVIKSCPE